MKASLANASLTDDRDCSVVTEFVQQWGKLCSGSLSLHSHLTPTASLKLPRGSRLH